MGRILTSLPTKTSANTRSLIKIMDVEKLKFLLYFMSKPVLFLSFLVIFALFFVKLRQIFAFLENTFFAPIPLKNKKLREFTPATQITKSPFVHP